MLTEKNIVFCSMSLVLIQASRNGPERDSAPCLRSCFQSMADTKNPPFSWGHAHSLCHWSDLLNFLDYPIAPQSYKRSKYFFLTAAFGGFLAFFLLVSFNSKIMENFNYLVDVSLSGWGNKKRSTAQLVSSLQGSNIKKNKHVCHSWQSGRRKQALARKQGWCMELWTSSLGRNPVGNVGGSYT